MRALTALALLMSLALQWPVQVLLELMGLCTTPSAANPTRPECGGILTRHHVCKDPR